MKPRVGREVTFGERLAPVQLPKERRRPSNVLDLRDAQPIPVRPPEPRVRVHDRMAEDAARVRQQSARPAPVAPRPQAAPQPRAAQRLPQRPTVPMPPPRRQAPVPPQPAQRQPQPQPPAQPVPKKRGLFARKPKPAPAPRRPLTAKRVASATLKVLITLAGAIVFLSFNSVALPERLIGIYFVASVVYAFDSQRTFLVALIFLAMVAVSSAIGQSVPAENYAIYAFYFLVIGLVAAIREQITNRSKTVGLNSQLSKR
jgi:hypothetical protein